MRKAYRAAVIGRTGKGNYGHGLDQVWSAVPEIEVVGVADENPEGLAAAAKKLKVSAAFADYREMLDKVKPDLVSICSRWIDCHRDMVVAAAERSVHIYLEKPLCRTLAEADEMIAACERHKVKLAIAHQTRYSPRVTAVRDLIADGKLGKILEYRGRGKEDRRGGSEDLWVLGTHVMDLTRCFAGDATWCMGSVTQNGRPIRKADVVEGPEGIGPLAGDAVHAMYGMADGAPAYFSSVRNMTGKLSRFGLQIYGSEGIVEILTGHLPDAKFLADPSWSPGRSGAKWQNVTSAGIDQPEGYKDGGLHGGNVLAVKDLIAAIEQDREPEGSIYEARSATEMIVAVFESQRVGGPVTLPLKTRTNPLTMLT